jgi:hypothetical protein
MTVARLRLIALVFVVALVFAATSLMAASDRRIAIVIENSEYKNAGTLDVVRNSARDVADALRLAGFEVIFERNLDRSGMQRFMESFQNPLGRSNFAIVYYSGLTLSIKDKSFLLPVDASLGSEFEATMDSIGLDEFLEKINNPTYMSLVAIDPVAQNPLARSLARAMGSLGDTVRPVPGKPKAWPNMIFAVAMQPGAGSAPTTGGVTPFSAAMIEELLRPGVEVGNAMAAVERSARARAGGQPFIQGRLQEKVVLIPEPRAERPTVATTPIAPTPPPVTLPPPAPASPVAAEPVDPINTPYLTTKDVNLRQAPGGAVIGSIPRGTSLTATGRARSSPMWVQVEHGGKLGFVHVGNLADPATVAASTLGNGGPGSGGVKAGETSASPSRETGIEPGEYVVSNHLTIFEKPALGARSNRELDAGAPVTILGSTPDGAWVQIRDAFSREGYLPRRSALGDLEVAKADQSANVPKAPAPAPADKGKVSPPPSASPAVAAETDALFALRPDLKVPLTAEVRQSAQLAVDAAAKVSVAGGILSEAEAASRKAREARESALQAAQSAKSRSVDGFMAVALADGGSYEGQWKSGAKHGAGRYRYPNGDIYEGAWQNDLMHGHGVYQYANGDRYEGQMTTNQATGYGIIYFSNGDVYKGRVNNALFNDYGTIAFKRGDVYEGQFSTGGVTGHGIMTFPDGSRFIGRFEKGKQKGPGVFVFGDGEDYRQGLWDGNQSASR